MKIAPFFPLILGLMLVSCGGDDTEYNEREESAVVTVDYDEYSKEMIELEDKVVADPGNKLLMEEATTKFQDFAGFFPDDPKAPDYLFKASDFSLMLLLPEKSVKILDRIIRDYPNYEKMIDVKYNRASHLDWEIRDTTRAKQAWQEFLAEYPNDSRAVDAKLRIKYIQYGFEEYSEMVINGQIEQPVN